jgi:Flp pilus assembly protein TadG
MVATEEGEIMAKRRRSAEQGQASIELVLVLPLLVLLILGALALGRLLYVHLAILTAANDCAISAAQAPEFDHMMGQGFTARENSLRTFQVSQSVATGAIYSAVTAHNSNGNIACQVGYPLELRWLGTFAGSIMVGPQFFSVEYTVNLPWQPYKSSWDEVAAP